MKRRLLPFLCGLFFLIGGVLAPPLWGQKSLIKTPLSTSDPVTSLSLTTQSDFKEALPASGVGTWKEFHSDDYYRKNFQAKWRTDSYPAGVFALVHNYYVSNKAMQALLVSPALDMSKLSGAKLTLRIGTAKYKKPQETQVLLLDKEGNTLATVATYSANPSATTSTYKSTDITATLPRVTAPDNVAFLAFYVSAEMNKGANVAISQVVLEESTEPAISLSPESGLEFSAEVNKVSEAQTVTVAGANLTAAPTYEVTGDHKDEFTVTGTLTQEGGTLSVTFSPKAEGVRTATLTVKGNDVTKSVSLTGYAVAPPPPPPYPEVATEVLQNGSFKNFTGDTPDHFTIVGTTAKLENGGVGGSEALSIKTPVMGKGFIKQEILTDVEGKEIRTGAELEASISYVVIKSGTQAGPFRLKCRWLNDKNEDITSESEKVLLNNENLWFNGTTTFITTKFRTVAPANAKKFVFELVIAENSEVVLDDFSVMNITESQLQNFMTVIPTYLPFYTHVGVASPSIPIVFQAKHCTDITTTAMGPHPEDLKLTGLNSPFPNGETAGSLIFTPSAKGYYPTAGGQGYKIRFLGETNVDAELVAYVAEAGKTPSIAVEGGNNVELTAEVSKSGEKEITITPNNVISDITLKLNNDAEKVFALSTEQLNYNPSEQVLSDKTFKITFTPKAEKEYTASVVLSYVMGDDVTITLKGTGKPKPIDPAPATTTELLDNAKFTKFNAVPDHFEIAGTAKKIDTNNAGFGELLDDTSNAVEITTGNEAGYIRQTIDLTAKKVVAGAVLQASIPSVVKQSGRQDGALRLNCKWLDASNKEITTTDERQLLNNAALYYSTSSYYTPATFRTVAPAGAAKFVLEVEIAPNSVVSFDEPSLKHLSKVDLAKPFIAALPFTFEYQTKVGTAADVNLVIQTSNLKGQLSAAYKFGKNATSELAIEGLNEIAANAIVSKKLTLTPATMGYYPLRYKAVLSAAEATPITLLATAYVADKDAAPSITLPEGNDVTIKAKKDASATQTITFVPNKLVSNVKFELKDDAEGVFAINPQSLVFNATKQTLDMYKGAYAFDVTFTPKEAKKYTAKVEITYVMGTTVVVNLTGDAVEEVVDPSPAATYDAMTNGSFVNFTENKPEGYEFKGTPLKLEGIPVSTGYDVKDETNRAFSLTTEAEKGYIRQVIPVNAKGQTINAGAELEGSFYAATINTANKNGAFRLACKWLDAEGNDITPADERKFLNNEQLYFNGKAAYSNIKFRTVAPKNAAKFVYEIEVAANSSVRFDYFQFKNLQKSEQTAFAFAIPSYFETRTQVGKTESCPIAIQTKHINVALTPTYWEPLSKQGSTAINIEGLTLTGNGVATGTFTFKPNKPGFYKATNANYRISLNGTDYAKTIFNVLAYVAYKDGMPAITVAEGNNKVMEVEAVNQTATETITINPMRVISEVNISLKQDENGPFKLSAEKLYYNLRNQALTDKAFKVTFTPKDDKEYRATVTLTYEMGEPVVIELLGKVKKSTPTPPEPPTTPINYTTKSAQLLLNEDFVKYTGENPDNFEIVDATATKLDDGKAVSDTGFGLQMVTANKRGYVRQVVDLAAKGVVAGNLLEGKILYTTLIGGVSYKPIRLACKFLNAEGQEIDVPEKSIMNNPTLDLYGNIWYETAKFRMIVPEGAVKFEFAVEVKENTTARFDDFYLKNLTEEDTKDYFFATFPSFIDYKGNVCETKTYTYVVQTMKCKPEFNPIIVEPTRGDLTIEGFTSLKGNGLAVGTLKLKPSKAGAFAAESNRGYRVQYHPSPTTNAKRFTELKVNVVDPTKVPSITIVGGDSVTMEAYAFEQKVHNVKLTLKNIGGPSFVAIKSQSDEGVFRIDPDFLGFYNGAPTRDNFDIIFTPKAAKTYTAEITITNEGAGVITLHVTGKGKSVAPAKTVELMKDPFFYEFEEGKPKMYEVAGKASKLEAKDGYSSDTGFALGLETTDTIGYVRQNVSLAVNDSTVINAGAVCEGTFHYYTVDGNAYPGPFRLACKWLDAGGNEIASTDDIVLDNQNVTFGRKKAYGEARFRTVVPLNAASFRFQIDVKQYSSVRFDDFSFKALSQADADKQFVSILPAYLSIQTTMGVPAEVPTIIQTRNYAKEIAPVFGGEEGALKFKDLTNVPADANTITSLVFTPAKKGIFALNKPYKVSVDQATVSIAATVAGENYPAIEVDSEDPLTMQALPGYEAKQTIKINATDLIGSVNVKVVADDANKGVFLLNTAQLYYSPAKDSLLVNNVVVTFRPKEAKEYKAQLVFTTPLADEVTLDLVGKGLGENDVWVEKFTADNAKDPRFTGDAWNNYHNFDKGYWYLDGAWQQGEEANGVQVKTEGLLQYDDWFPNGVKSVAIKASRVNSMVLEYSIDGGGSFTALEKSNNNTWSIDTHRPTIVRLRNTYKSDVTVNSVLVTPATADARENYAFEKGGFVKHNDVEPLAVLNETFDNLRHTRLATINGWENLALYGNIGFTGWQVKNDKDEVEETCVKSTFYQNGVEDSTKHDAWLVSPMLSYQKAANKVVTFRFRYATPSYGNGECMPFYIVAEDAEGNVKSHFINYLDYIPLDNVAADKWFDVYIDLSKVADLKIDDKFFLAFELFSKVGGSATTLQYLVDDVTFGVPNGPVINVDKDMIAFDFRKGETISQEFNVTTENARGEVSLTLETAANQQNAFALAPLTLPATGGKAALAFKTDKEGDCAAKIVLQSRGAEIKVIKVLARDVTATQAPLGQQIVVYPTTTTGTVYVTGVYNMFNLFSINGELVLSGKATESVDLSGVANGMYIIQIIDNAGVKHNFRIQKN